MIDNKLNNALFRMKKRKLFKLDLCYILEGDLYISAVYKDGLFSIIGHPEWCEDNSRDIEWINGKYKSVRVIYDSNEYNTNNKQCYVILKDINGNGVIIDLLTKETIKKDFPYDEYKSCTKRTIELNYEYKDDLVLKFLNDKKKSFSLYSISEGYIFGPYDYKDVKEFQYGVILDNKIAVENDGWTNDLSLYNNDGQVYFNEKEYLLFVDEDGCLFTFMDEDENNDSILKAETKDYIYTYNKETEELNREVIEDHDSLFDFLQHHGSNTTNICDDDNEWWD